MPRAVVLVRFLCNQQINRVELNVAAQFERHRFDFAPKREVYVAQLLSSSGSMIYLTHSVLGLIIESQYSYRGL